MALSYGYVRTESPQAKEKLENVKRNSAQVFMRDEAQLRALMAPWKVRESRRLAWWLGVEHRVGEADREGIDAEMYGVMLAREE